MTNLLYPHESKAPVKNVGIPGLLREAVDPAELRRGIELWTVEGHSRYLANQVELSVQESVKIFPVAPQGKFQLIQQ